MLQGKNIARVLVPVILVLAGTAYFVFDPTVSTQLFPKCPFHSLTGLQCPGCGSQRAIHCLLHIDFIEAFRYNFMFVIAIPFIFLYIIAEWFNYHHWFDWAYRLFHHKYTMPTIGVVFVLWWAVRVVTGV